MNRSALRPTDTFIGRPALIGTSMVMGCFSRTDTVRSWVPLHGSADAYETPGAPALTKFRRAGAWDVKPPIFRQPAELFARA
jgi:hypothetical protein